MCLYISYETYVSLHVFPKMGNDGFSSFENNLLHGMAQTYAVQLLFPINGVQIFLRTWNPLKLIVNSETCKDHVCYTHINCT